MDYEKLSEDFDKRLSKVTKLDYEKWCDLDDKFCEVLNSMTDSDWNNWMKNRASKKEIRRLVMIEKANKQQAKISMENGLTKDESDSIAKAIYEMQMLGLNVINSEEIKLTEELDKLKETTIERILLKKDINLFGFYFSKGCLVLFPGDHLELKYGESNRYVTIPLICGTFGKTSTEFMNELSKQNNN